MENPKNLILKKLNLISDIFVAILLVSCISILFTILIHWTPLLYIDYLNLWFDFDNGYIIFTNIPVGMHILPNIIFVVLVWCYLDFETSRKVKIYLATFSFSKFLQKVVHIFF